MCAILYELGHPASARHENTVKIASGLKKGPGMMCAKRGPQYTDHNSRVHHLWHPTLTPYNPPANLSPRRRTTVNTEIARDASNAGNACGGTLSPRLAVDAGDGTDHTSKYIYI